jgi:CheY-like chemotaxis protein
MIRLGSRWGIGLAFLAILLSRAPAQEGKDAPAKRKPLDAPAQDGKAPPAKDNDPAVPGKDAAPGKQTGPADDDYRQFFKKPQTVAEFWKALQFELEVGRADLAAALLHGLMLSKPSEDALVELADREGMAAILRLRNLKPWVAAVKPDTKDIEAEIARVKKTTGDIERMAKLRTDIANANKDYENTLKLNEQAEKDTEALIALVTEAVKKVRGDPKRIASLISLLSASPEEGAYALKELYKSGALAVPQIIDGLGNPSAPDRADLLSALQRLGSDVVPPIVAALDSDDAQLKIDLLDVLLRRAAVNAAPNLWFLSASPTEPEIVRRKATQMLAAFLDTQPTRLPAAKAMLTREAERYYQHQIHFPNSNAVTVWRWDNGHVVAGWPGVPTVPATVAEEYWGIRFANQALALDPSYRPARVALLSLALDKAAEKGGVVQPLAKVEPKVHALLASTSPELIGAVLERALDERRTPVVLNSVRTLGGLADPRANRPSVKGEPVLVRALYYPDRRVQFAAAEAILRGPDSIGASAATRVLDVLRRALVAEAAAGGSPKILVAFSRPEHAARVAEAVRAAGFEAVTAHTGREVMRRLGQAADIDLLLLDSALPDPGLAGLLGQLNADTYAGHLPIVLMASADREGALRRYTERDPRLILAPANMALVPEQLQTLLKRQIAGAAGGPPLAPAELQDYAERAIRHLNDLAHGNPAGIDVRPAADAILEVLRAGKLSPDGQLAAISAAGKFYGGRAQNDLVAVIQDGRRPLPVRIAATRELVHHIQLNSVLLTAAQAAALEALFADSRTDPALRAELALLLGSLKPDSRVTGERLLKYQPTPPAAANAAPALKEEKEKEKE